LIPFSKSLSVLKNLQLNYGDLQLFVVLDLLLWTTPDIFNEFSSLKTFRDTIASRPNIASYLSSKLYFKPLCLPENGASNEEEDKDGETKE